MHYYYQRWIRSGSFGSSVGVVCELSRRVDVAGGGFVHNFDCGDHIRVVAGAVFGSDGFEHGDREREVRGFLPVDWTSVAGVVETVLGAGGAVAVEEDLEAGCATPSDCVVEVGRGAEEVGGVGVVEGPIANRNTEALGDGE